MKNFPLFAAALVLGGILLGSSGAYALIKRDQAPATQTDSMSGMSHDMGSMNDMSMSAMNADLKGKTGDDFDKAFLSMMMEHHQGAIEMAMQAKQNAKHSELKTMADDIISAQTREIEQMKAWQKQWGY